jgi:hypothetical protein
MIKLNSKVQNGTRRAVKFGAYSGDVRVLPRGVRFEVAVPGLVDDFAVGAIGSIDDDAMKIAAVAKSDYLREWVVLTVEPVA